MTGIALREAAPGDEAFLRAVYRSVREPELALTPWGEEQKATFANFQFDMQDRAYRASYPAARFLMNGPTSFGATPMAAPRSG